jgi:hypothetical protein
MFQTNQNTTATAGTKVPPFKGRAIPPKYPDKYCGDCKHFGFKGLDHFCKLRDKVIPRECFGGECKKGFESYF